MDEFINIQEAARRLGVSEKTIRRLVKRHKLPERREPVPYGSKVEQGRFLFAVSDIEALRSTHGVQGVDTTDMRAELDDLKHHVSELERELSALKASPPTKVRSPARPEEEKEEAPAQPGEKRLPEGLVVAATYAKQHGIAPSTIQKAMDDRRLQAQEGTWVVGKTPVKRALDAAGRVQFHQLYSSNAHFVAPDGCEECLKYELLEGLVDWQAFAELHHANTNEVRRLMGQGHIRAVKGPWRVGRRFIDKALDAQGRRGLWIQFHNTDGFRACDDCPHQG